MTLHQAKQDAARRLTAGGITYTKLTAKTVSFEDLARANPVFVTIHGATQPWRHVFADLPKPSAGGYIPT
jgi:hypothetical protein